MCERWNDFQNFYDDMGPDPGKGYELERKDNEGHYSPDNVIWVTRIKNAQNKRTTIRVEYAGKEWCLSELCRQLEVPYQRVWKRYRLYNWPIEESLHGPA